MTAPLAAAWLALAVPARAGAAPAPDPLSCLDFLVGSWAAEGGGGPGSGSGEFVFERKQEGRALVRVNRADYPARGGEEAQPHADLMVVAPDKEGLRATFVDTEGHVIRYGVSCERARRAVFLSAEEPGQPRFRLTYELEPGSRLGGLFEIAPPGKPFSPYLRWTARPEALTAR